MIKKLFFLLLISTVMIKADAQQTPPSAQTVLSETFSKAKAEKKNVFIIFHASWCGWCRKMDASMNDTTCRKFFQDNYVIEHLTVFESQDKKHLENPGAEALMLKHSGGKTGIPFWIIYDPAGNVLATALTPEGNNTGCPASESEVSYFISALKKSAPLDEAMEKAIYERFRRNEIRRRAQ
jgi:Thiol:disulfide interchange protein